MKFKNVYTPKAAFQYEEIVAWYSERSIVAPENFIKEVEMKVKTICENPFQYRNTYKHFREDTAVQRKAIHAISFCAIDEYC